MLRSFARIFVVGVSATASLLVVGIGSPAASPAPVLPGDPGIVESTRDCQSLAKIEWPDGSRVMTAIEVPASGLAPEFCSVTLLVPDQINISVLLPTDTWNSRYLAMGNGGFAGVPMYTDLQPQTQVAKGYVVSATDTGHIGTPANGAWAWSPNGMNHRLIQDFAYRANHEMALKTKDLIGHLYGRGPSFSYWFGASSGGREGLTAATRYPLDFDGVVAGQPAINWTRFTAAEMWPQLVMKEAGNFLPSAKQAEVNRVVTGACDDSDGLVDGLFDPRQCNFTADQLLGKQTPGGRFTSSDVDVMRKIWEGPRGNDGRFLWYGLEPGADLGSIPGMTLGGAVGLPNGPTIDGVPFLLSGEWFKWWLHKDPAWDWHTLSYEQFEKDFDQSVTEWADVLSTDNPDLVTFRDNGGKVIIWHGLADQLIFPKGTIEYYNRVADRMGGLAETAQFARLFLAPGVAHSFSGPAGPGPADPLAALVEWREHSRAPDTLPATLGPHTGANTTNMVMTRPLCPYPQVSRYRGFGSTFEAESFECGGEVR